MTWPAGTAVRRGAVCAGALWVLVSAVGATPAVAEELVPRSDTATALMAVNAAPQAGDDVVATYRDTEVTIDLLANDVDPDGDALTLVGATSAGHGVLSFTGGVVQYTPDADWTGVEDFTYLVDDGRGGQDTGHVRITVAAPTVARPHPTRPTETAPVLPAVPPAAVVPVAPAPPAPVSAGGARVTTSATGPGAVAAQARAATTLPLTGSPTVALAALGAGLTALGSLLCAAGRRPQPQPTGRETRGEVPAGWSGRASTTARST